jgi:hypothetical protein
MKSLKEILLIASLLIGALVLAKYTNIHSPVYRMPHHIPRKDANAPKEINGVPLTIYQSWGTHEIPHHMANNIKQVLEKNPEFDYYLYSDEECRMFIQHNFPAERMDECMWNGFMIAPPGFEIFKFCIEEIVQACKQKSYMRNPLDITGPCLLGRVVKKHDAQKFLYYNMLILTGPESIYWNTDKVFTKYSQYRAEQKQFQRSNHYDELWKTSRVYHE